MHNRPRCVSLPGSRRFAVDQRSLRGVVARIPETARRIAALVEDNLAGDILEVGRSRVEEDSRKRIEEDTDCMDRTFWRKEDLDRVWNRERGIDKCFCYFVRV